MSEAGRVFKEVKKALSPVVLREKITLHYQQVRETYTPRTLRPSSEEELMDELERYMKHLFNETYKSPDGRKLFKAGEWKDLAEHRDMLLRRLYAGAPLIGREAFLECEERGLRYVLDKLTRAEEGIAIGAHVDKLVYGLVKPLDNDDKMRLAELYLEQFRHLPNMPEIYVTHLGYSGLLDEYKAWRETFASHARSVLYG